MTAPAGGPLEQRAAAYELAFAEAGRALDAQERAVNELRSRAGILLAAAAVATSFFGGGSATGERAGLGVTIAIAAFARVGMAALAVAPARVGVRRERSGSHRGIRRARDGATRTHSVISRCIARRVSRPTPRSSDGS